MIILISILMLLHAHYLPATIVVRGDGTLPQTFAGEVSTKVFDAATGTLYLGVQTSTEYTLSKIGRAYSSPFPPPKATGIAAQALQSLLAFRLALASFEGNTQPLLVGVPNTNNRVFAQSTDGKQFAQLFPVLDANGAQISAVVNIAANYDFIFGAVAPASSSFGAPNSGIAVVRINKSLSRGLPVLTSLTQTAAEPGLGGVRAKRVDPTIEEVRTSSDEPIIGDGSLFWDEKLNRLYIGLKLTSNAAATAGAKSIIVARVENGALVFSPIMPSNALINGQTDKIVGVKGPSRILTVNYLNVMHTSTGTSYLIVNGGNGQDSLVGNQIYALPLVDNSNNQTTHGTLAAINSTLEENDPTLGTVKFVTPATANSQLPSSDDSAARVGNGPFPLTPDNIISDMVVVGDTVYASSNVSPSATNETGIFSSQALFDGEGKIIRWTPWAKRSFPVDGIPTDASTGRVLFFAVDDVTGNIWAVDGDTGQTVAVTQWDNGLNTSSLVTRLNTTFKNGVFSILDLDQATRGLGVDNPNRFALFGGAGTVALARTSISQNSSAPFNLIAGDVPAPQQVIDDFNNPANFLVRQLPGCANAVTVLEFSRRTAAEGNTTYFFAGTQQGLYVFSRDTGQGFNVASFSNLQLPPLSTGIWQKATSIPGSIVDIKTSGKMLYVLTLQSTTHLPYKNVLYRIPFRSTFATMFDASNLIPIAQTNSAPVFDATTLFTSMQIIKTGAVGTEDNKEQLVLGTNKGVYISDANQTTLNGIIDATNQTTARWKLAPFLPPAMVTSIAGMDTPLPATVWPFLVNSRSKFSTDQLSSIAQLNGSGEVTGTHPFFNAVPTVFNASSTAQPFRFLPPISSFYSDGARRFFVINNQQVPTPASSRLMLLPWNIQQVNISNPTNGLIFAPGLATTSTYYWVHQIGATGILMAGTQQGVVALE